MGDPRAKQLLDATAERMRPGDIKKARTLTAEWTPPAAPKNTPAASGLFNSALETATTAAMTVATRPAESAAGAPATTANRPVTMPGSSADRTAPSTTTTPAIPVASTRPAETAASAPASPANRPVSMAGGGETSGAPAEKLAATASAANRATTLPRATPQATSNTWTGVERVIAVGDVHGDYEQFVAVLRSAGLIDTNANWIGGHAHLVQTGDVVDRGPDSRAVMDLLMRLEKQAVAAGGAVHVLIGNHEAMDVYGDLRYVSPGEFASYRPGPVQADTIGYPDRAPSPTAAATPVPGAVQNQAEAPGYAEHRAAFSP